MPVPVVRAAVTGPAVAAAFGPDGRLWRAVPDDSGLGVDWSADLGATFSEPVRVSPRRQRIRAVPEDRPAISVDPAGRVFVTWAADGPRPWTRYIAWSGDGGRTFSAPLGVNDAASRVEQNQTVVQATGAGDAAVLWLDSRGGRPGIASLALARFRSAAWGTPASTALFDGMCECCRLAVQPAPGGGWAVFGRMVFAGGVRDMGLVRVGADGAATARRVTDDGWAIEACPEHGPGLAIGASGRYHLAWFTQGARRQGLFYARSDDGGVTLTEPMAFGSRDQLAGHADVGALGATVALAWQQYDGRRTTVHAMLSTDEGASWGAPREIAGAAGPADYPFVLSDGRALYLSWYAVETGYRLVRLDGATP